MPVENRGTLAPATQGRTSTVSVTAVSDRPTQSRLPEYLYRRTYLLVAALSLILVLSVHINYLSSVNYLTHDDMWMDFLAKSISVNGTGQYWQEARRDAISQGRVDYFVSLLGWIGPFFSKSDASRALLVTGVHLLSLIGIGLFVRRYFGTETAFLFLIIFYNLLPYLRRHFPVGGYPIAYHLPIALFFFGILGFTGFRSRLRLRFVQVAVKSVGLLAVFLSLFFYEAFDLCFLFIAVLTLALDDNDWTRGDWRPALTRFGRKAYPLAICFAVYAVIYVTWTTAHPSDYPGTKLSLHNLDLSHTPHDIATFVLSGFPLFYDSTHLGELAPFWHGSIRTDGMLRFILDNVTALDILRVVVFWAAIVLYAKLPIRLLRGRIIRVGLTTLFIATLFAAPSTLAQKYHGQADIWAPYAPGYVSLICFTVVFAAGIALMAQIRGRMRLPLISLQAAAISAAVLATSMANHAHTTDQSQDYGKWRLVDGLLRSDFGKRIPDGATIVAPDLWKGFNPDWPMAATYWSSYFSLHSRKAIQVVPSISDRVPLGGGNVFICQMAALPEQSSWMVLGRISGDRVDHLKHTLLADSLTVISERDYKNMVVSVLTPVQSVPVGDDSGRVVGSRNLLLLPPLGGDGGVYVASMATQPWIAGTAELLPVGPTELQFPLVYLDFGPTFSGLESGNGTYWRWNTSPTGAVEIRNDANHVINVRLNARIGTGRTLPTRFELGIDGREERASFSNNDTFNRVVRVPPGKVKILLHSEGSPVPPSPGDPRKLFFALADWKLTELP